MAATIDPAWLAPQALEHAHALAAPLYADAAVAERERRAIFARSWQLVGHAGQVQAPGDHALAEVAGVPLLLVRDAAGEVRALHNVCRHRAGPLATCDGRGARELRCHYHGWTYHLDGRLRTAPQMQDATGFCVESVRLPQTRLEQWQGLLFAALDPAAALDEVLSGIGARLGSRSLATLVCAGRHSYEIACDWKTYVDNYLEGYHLPHVHPRLNRMLDYRSYRTTLAAWHCLQHSPLESAATLYGNGEALYYFIWPNTMLNILPGRLQTNRVVPLAPGRCRVDFEYFHAPDTPPATHAADVAFSDEVQREDIAICEQVQQRLASGSYLAGRINPARENGVWHFHELYRSAMRGR